MRKKVVYIKFQGNIENNNAICNVAECSQFSTKPTQMIIPSEYCTESNDVISIERRVFDKLRRNGLIQFNY